MSSPPPVTADQQFIAQADEICRLAWNAMTADMKIGTNFTKQQYNNMLTQEAATLMAQTNAVNALNIPPNMQGHVHTLAFTWAAGPMPTGVRTIAR